MKTNNTGLAGVVRRMRKRGPDRFIAQIMVRGVHRHLGSFATAEEAHAAYRKAREEAGPQTRRSLGRYGFSRAAPSNDWQ